MAIQDDFTVSDTGNIRYVGSDHGVGASATITGSITGTTLTVTVAGTGSLGVGMMITGTNILAGTKITAQLTGSFGGTGTYSVNNTHAATGSQTLTGHASNYYTVIAFHRYLQDLADNSSAAISSATSADYLDITDKTPSERSTDNIITLLNGFNIDLTAAEHLYDGSIIQNSGTDVWDGLAVIGGAGMDLQIVQCGVLLTNDFWNSYPKSISSATVSGAHSNNATTLNVSDGTQFHVGGQLRLTTSGGTDEYRIKSIATNALTIGKVTSGEPNWTVGLNGTLAGGEKIHYGRYKGINSDTNNGISHRFMIKVKSSASMSNFTSDGITFTNADNTTTGDIDGRKLLGQTRVFGYTYSEFKINGTSRGNNVMALSYAGDLNNAKSEDTVGAFTGISNQVQGYIGIDVSGDGSVENYYSRWTKGSNTINDFYEYMKYVTRQGTSTTLYGLNGQVFRGITHELDVGATRSGTFNAFELVKWGTGATAGTGQMLAINSTTAATKMWIQLLTGVAPSGSVTITGQTSSATVTYAGTQTERTLSFPFCGVSTGSAIIGSYGFGILAGDLVATDKVFDLTNTQITPPNNQTFSVTGLAAGLDYVLVGPEESSTIKLDQFTLNAGLTTDNVTSVVVAGAANTIPADTPSTGYIRVEDNNGNFRRLHFTSRNRSTNTFTIDTTDGNEDFASVNANAGKRVFISYIDEIAGTGTPPYTLDTSLTTGAVTSLIVSTQVPASTPSTGYIQVLDDLGVWRRIAYSARTINTPAGKTTFTISSTNFTAPNDATAGTGVFVEGQLVSASYTAVYSTARALYARVRFAGTSGSSYTDSIKTFESPASFPGSSAAIRTADA